MQFGLVGDGRRSFRKEMSKKWARIICLLIDDDEAAIKDNITDYKV